MSNQTISMSDAVYDYYRKLGFNEPELLRELRHQTASLNSHAMQIAPEQGQFMAMLIKLLGVKDCIELGTYTGYSALAMALALPATGRLITCDIDPHTTKIAQRYWERGGVTAIIELRLAPALETLNSLVSQGLTNHFDMAFIDADKRHYLVYYEILLTLIRPGGLILVDNVLWGGRVADFQDNEKSTQALREFNEFIATDQRIEHCIIPIGDGLTLVRKLVY